MIYLVIFAVGMIIGALLARAHYLRELNEMDEIATEAVELTRRALATTKAAYGQQPKQQKTRRARP